MVMIILIWSYHHLRETNEVYDQYQVKWFGPLWKVYWSWTGTDRGPLMGLTPATPAPAVSPRTKGNVSLLQLKPISINRRVRGKNQVHGVDMKRDPRLQTHTAQVASRNASSTGLVTGRNRKQEMGPWLSNMNSPIICTSLVLVGVS